MTDPLVRQRNVTASGSAVELSVIVPAWNEEAYLGTTLASLNACLGNIDASSELIVVDNNSTDATSAVASDAGAMVVFEPINQIARARNSGARTARGQWLLFVDADTSVSTELVSAVLDRLRSGATVGGGATVELDQQVGRVARIGLDFWNLISSRLKLAAGSCVWCRRDAFEQVGGFPQSRYAGEELVLSRQLKRWGRKRGMNFLILSHAPVETSARKLQWYGPLDIARQTVLALIPGALGSKRMMHTWYDDAGRRAMRKEQSRPKTRADEP